MPMTAKTLGTIVGTVQVGHRTVKMTLTFHEPDKNFIAVGYEDEWRPDVPKGNRLPADEYRQWVEGRDALAAALANRLGLAVETISDNRATARRNAAHSGWGSRTLH
jgi:hypothetical protein